MFTSKAKLVIGNPWLFTIMEILENRSFSNSFDKIGSRLIGLYDSVSSAGLPGFLEHNFWYLYKVPYKIGVNFMI